MFNFLYAFASLILFGASLTFSMLFGALMMKTGVVDAPDGARKTQASAVPRLGGVSIAGALVCALILLPLIVMAISSGDPKASLIGVAGLLDLLISNWLVAAFTLSAFLIGLWDDIGTAPTKLKLALLALASVVAAYYGLHPDALNSPFGNLTTPAVLIIGSALWLLVFTNAVNFMDGSDGIASGSLLIMFGGLALASDVLPHLGWFALLGAIAGFLIHNLRGTLYAGDTGALGLGALFASLGLVSGLEVWTVATLALPFLIDVLMTLIWRAKHKRSWLRPHRDHAYQRLIDSGWSHIEVAVLYWGLSAACAVAAIITAKAGGEAPFVIFWTLTLAGIVMWSLNRREYRGE